MIREMNRKERQLSAEDTVKIFAQGNHGILAVNGDDGYPYAVPVNYVYESGRIYIHSAKHGYKVDAVKNNNKVCFSAILNSEIQQEKCTAAYQSVIAFGKLSFVEEEAEKRKILERFVYKMAPDFVQNGMDLIERAIDKTALLCIDVEEIKGKQSSRT